jgi:hypothetical protein
MKSTCCGASGLMAFMPDGATTARLMVLHLHPWIMGQPWRIRHLDEVLGHICARHGVWTATGREIIDWLKAQSSQLHFLDRYIPCSRTETTR